MNAPFPALKLLVVAVISLVVYLVFAVIGLLSTTFAGAAGPATIVVMLLAGFLYLASDRASTEPESGSWVESLRSGDYGLPKTYWIFGALIPAIVGAIYSTVFFASSDAVAVVLSIAMLGLLIWYYTLWVPGTWRAARAYEGPAFWSVLAQIGVVLSVLGLIGYVLAIPLAMMVGSSRVIIQNSNVLLG